MTQQRYYALGFVLSLFLTVTAYFVVRQNLLSGGMAVVVLMSLALIQLWVQLIMFLHLGEESGPRWKLLSWLSTFGVLVIVIVGSLVIMRNLNYHMPSAEEIMHSENIYK